MSGRWRDGLLALLFANFCFARVWSELVDYSAADSFFFFRPPPAAAYLAVWANILVWAAVSWAMLQWLRRYRVPPVLSGAAFFLVCLIPLNALRAVMSTRLQLLRAGLFVVVGTRGVTALISFALLILIVVVWRFGARVQAAAVSTLFLTTPLLALQFAATGWRLLSAQPDSFANRPLRPFQERAATAQIPGSPRVVWIIFDEMDYRLSFPERPKTLLLPAFDRLSAGAVHLTHALPPANWTGGSVPALLHGATIRELRPMGPGRAEIAYSDSAGPGPWNSSQTIFSTARQLGYNSAVVGWYLPYCRVLNDDLSVCDWTAMSNQMNSTGGQFREILLNQNRSLFETSLLSPFGQSLTIKGHIDTVQANLQHARQAVSDPRLGLVFLHFPVPHPPPVYDRFRQTMTISNSPLSGYIDSLALADRILGQLREAMERCGLWEKTTVLVTADHSFRASAALDGKYDPRIPYVLKLPGESRGEQYDEVFPTVRTRSLLTAILQGELQSPGDVVHWMDQKPN